MTSSRINGWKRLWVVIALATLPLTVFFSFKSAIETSTLNYGVMRDLENPECEQIRTLPKGFLAEERLDYGTPCSDLYFHNQIAAEPSRSVEAYQEEVSRRHWEAVRSWLMVSLLAWVAGLAVLYVAGVAVAWVRRGFTQVS